VTIRRGRRRRHAGQSGLTLIELLVTISIMGIGFLSLLAAFSTIELTAGATADDAQLTSQARQVQDYVESENFAYIDCASAANYQSTLNTAISGAKVILFTGYSVVVNAVAQASGGSDTNGALSAINGCSGGNPDYGVQQIKFTVSSVSARHSLARIVYKRWN
jgi:prepilin-type N-terminal cleavage/methylation domain-containing protein